MSSIGYTSTTNFSVQPVEKSPYDVAIDLFQFMLSYAWIIAMMAGIVGGGAYLYASSQEHVYESYSNLIILPFGNPADGSEIEALRALNLNIVGTYIQILRSDNLNTTAINALGDTYPQALLDEVEVTISPITNSSIIRVQAHSTDPVLAQHLVTAITQATIERNPVESLIELYPIDILDVPSIPTDPISPNILQTTIMGVLVGGVLGFAIAYLMDFIGTLRRSANLSK